MVLKAFIQLQVEGLHVTISFLRASFAFYFSLRCIYGLTSITCKKYLLRLWAIKDNDHYKRSIINGPNMNGNLVMSDFQNFLSWMTHLTSSFFTCIFCIFSVTMMHVIAWPTSVTCLKIYMPKNLVCSDFEPMETLVHYKWT